MPVPQPEELAVEHDDMPLIEWKRPVLTVGALLVAAGLIGALAGSSLLDPQQSAQAERGPMFGRPVAKAATHAPVPAAAPAVAEARPQPAVAAPRARHERLPLHLDLAPPAIAQQAEASAPAADPVADASTAAPAGGADTAAAPSAAVESIASAGLPLAAKVMARTIERIGYACGSVASASPADGAAGVYKVTCTSGDTYRAAPVGGRYRFRRWSRH